MIKVMPKGKSTFEYLAMGIHYLTRLIPTENYAEWFAEESPVFCSTTFRSCSPLPPS